MKNPLGRDGVGPPTAIKTENITWKKPRATAKIIVNIATKVTPIGLFAIIYASISTDN
jgi:hypothetical protein